MRQTNRAFHLHMVDTTVHLLVLMYILRYVEGQPNWFYWVMSIFLIGYFLLGFLTIIAMLLPSQSDRR